MLHRTLTCLSCAAVVAAATATTASADKVIQAQTVWQFDASTYTLDQGEALTFKNGDQLSPGPHDVTSDGKGADGKPLFKSKTIPNGQDAPVEGARALKTGSYSFFCSVHPFMTATLNVTGNGTPLGAAAPAPPPDTKPPALTVSVGTTSLRKAVQTRSITTLLGADEQAALTARLTARVGKRTYAIGSAVAKTDGTAKRSRVVIRINSSALRPLRRARSATFILTVAARDPAGNVSRATARKTIRR